MSAARSAAHDMRLKITAVSSWALIQTLGPFLLLAAIAIWPAIHFASVAPPRRLTLSSGPKGSIFEANAQKYSKILARSGIKLNVIESEGSSDNLNRLSDPKSHVETATELHAHASLLQAAGQFPSPTMRLFLRSIERAVIARKMPGAHAEQLYVLREHIAFVRESLARSAVPSAAGTSSTVSGEQCPSG